MISTIVHEMVIYTFLAIPCLPWINTQPLGQLWTCFCYHEGWGGKGERSNLSVSFECWVMSPDSS